MVTKVSASQEISGICRKDNAWQHLTDIKRFPERISSIDTIRILERNDRSILSEWFISLDGAPFSWIERATLFPELYSYDFRAISGDFDLYQGSWKLCDNGSGALVVSSEIEYTLGIPVIEENVGPVLREKMQQFLSLSVARQCSCLSTGLVDERHEVRIPIMRHTKLHLDGYVADAEIINLSSRGMMFMLTKGMFDADANKKRTLILSGCSIKGYLYPGNGSSVHRMRFSEKLSRTTIRKLCHRWNISSEVIGNTVMICDIVKGKSAPRPHWSSLDNH